MSKLREGNIVVVMKQCHPGCALCPLYIGETALVAGVNVYNEVTLQFAGRVLGSGPAVLNSFVASDLFNTGLSA